ncbi:MAG: serpin family protein [Verrucomicrobiota bacterium]|nr:serpin family protein [Verrucomicrobiota bacterium]
MSLPKLIGVLLCLTGMQALAGPSAAETQLAAANTGFAFDLLRQISAAQPGQNIFLSPFSVSTALQMLGNGAVGRTRREIQNVLKTGALPPVALDAACEQLNRSLHSQTNAILALANGIWYQKQIRLKARFVADNRTYFGAELAGVDFQNPQSARAINGWAEQHTFGKIKQLVQWPFPRATRLVLANAIYFKGQWAEPFDKSQTRPREFHPAKGPPRQAPMMLQRRTFSYQEGDDFQAVRLPYTGGRLEMLLFLPATNSTPRQLLARFNAKSWRDKILPHFEDRPGTLILPRFKLDYSADLNGPLKALGMRRAFSPRADFSAMADQPLFVSQVKQKSYVEVNEEGTEAAAVTTVVMVGLARPLPRSPFEMIVDRPFLFVIRDRPTQTILFVGIVGDPASD